MIKDKEKVEKIYNYLSDLAKAHKSSAYKHLGWSLYDSHDKKHGFSVQKYCSNGFDCSYTTFELYDIDFNYKNNWFKDEINHERIYIELRVRKDFSELEITECQVKKDASLFDFFSKLDVFNTDFGERSVYLEQILLGKIKY